MEWTLIKISQGIIKTNMHKILVIIYIDYSKHWSLRRFNNFSRKEIRKKSFLRCDCEILKGDKNLVTFINIIDLKNFFNTKTNNIISRNNPA